MPTPMPRHLGWLLPSHSGLLSIMQRPSVLGSTDPSSFSSVAAGQMFRFGLFRCWWPIYLHLAALPPGQIYASFFDAAYACLQDRLLADPAIISSLFIGVASRSLCTYFRNIHADLVLGTRFARTQTNLRHVIYPIIRSVSLVNGDDLVYRCRPARCRHLYQPR